MAQRIPTRLGDGSLVEMTRAEIEADLNAGSELAAKRAKERAGPDGSAWQAAHDDSAPGGLLMPVAG